MNVSEEFKSLVIKKWFLPEQYLFDVIFGEFKEQYSRPGLEDDERSTFLKREARDRLEQEIEAALSNNDSPHIFLKVLEGIEPKPEDLYDLPVFVKW